MTSRPAIFWRGVAARRRRSDAFTLFEVILAIALSTVLLGLIGTAINLYLTRIESRRADVEWAQLARAVFQMIRNDLRAASEYKPQSMTGALAAAGTASSFSSSSIDAAATGTTGSTSTSGTSSSSGGTSAFGGSTSTSSSSSTTSSSTSSGTIDATSMQTTPGVFGTLMEVYVDASRPPRLDQLLSRYAGYSNVTVPNLPEEGGSNMMPRTTSGQANRQPMSDLRTVHYFVRSGEQVTDASSITATSLSPEGQLRVGGLVRQEIDRATRVAAELAGDQTILESGQRLIAPEVVGIEFRYYDGTQVLESWDTVVNGGLPPAIQVRLWLADPNDVQSLQGTATGQLAIRASAREFRQTIMLPLAKPSTTATSTSGTTGTSGTTTGTSGTQ